MSRYKFGDKEVSVTNANGVSGFILRGLEGRYFFRVYRDKLFMDYEIKHRDVEVIINDKLAAFYDNGEEQWLDYDPKTLNLVRSNHDPNDQNCQCESCFKDYMSSGSPRVQMRKREQER